MSPDTPGTPDVLPADLESQAAEILLGDPALLEERFAGLCAAHEPWRDRLLAFRLDYERAAQLLGVDESPPAATTPTAIGAYRFLRRIGSGAFGAVYLAEQQQPVRREVAVKVLHAPTGSARGNQRFQVERETLSRMNHPGIARIFDAGIDAEDRPYFVMEYVPGEPMHRFVAARAAGLDARLDLYLLACEGVNHAHQRGVIHRDLKPHNILVTEVDGRWQPKVIDFGLAKLLDDPERLVQTQAGAVLGTPAYMSPEQVRGDTHEVDTRTDVYALGVILYELLAGALPLDPERCRSGGLAAIQRLILDGEPPLASVRATQSGMPWARRLRGDLDWILRKAMAKRPTDRYPTIVDLAADVRRFLAEQPVTAGPPSTSYVLRKFVRRHRTAVITTGLVLASLVGGGVASARLWQQAVASAEEARAHLADFWRLADVVELESLVADAEALWPSAPSRLGDHEQWLRRADGLAARRDEHLRAVAAMQQRLDRQDGAPPLGDDELRGTRFLLGSLRQHLARLDEFLGPDGPLRSVSDRTRFAREVERRSLVEAAPAWAAAIAAVAADPHYQGVSLRPIVGLVPLGADPDSGLQEFAHLQSGDVPRRGDDGRLVLGPRTAIVLVLIPAREFVLGSQSVDPERPNHDPERLPFEGDVARTHLPAFLIGKYELTQGQVRNLGRRVHALRHAATPNLDLPPFDDRHPEESVLAPDVQRWLPHYELRLPELGEWEAAARAGSPFPFGAGPHPSHLQGCANVADAALAKVTGGALPCDLTLDDGYPAHAPVGSLRPNAFGLHDVLGNVAEMATATDETGAAIVLARGGSFALPPTGCRVGSTRLMMQNQASPEVGVRVARSLPH